MKFGCCVDIGKYDILSRLGYDFIELSGVSLFNMTENEFTNTTSIIHKGEIGCKGLNAFLAPDLRIIGHNVDRSRIINYLDTVLYRAAALGITQIGFGSPRSRSIPSGFSRAEALSQLIDFIELTLEKAKKFNIKLLMEPLNKTETNFINYTEEAMEIINSVKNPEFALLLDLYHFQMNNENPDIIDESLVKYLFHVHIADTDGRKYLNFQNYSKYTLLLEKLKKSGYNKTLSIEAKYNNFSKEAEKSLEILEDIDQ